jgi:uncharacterized protein YndB with AHSA1/START domain
MKVSPLILKRKLAAPREKVFEALSRPEILKLWFKPDPQWQLTFISTFKVGSPYEHTMVLPDGTIRNHMGEYKEIIPSRKIVFTFTVEDVNTLVIFELEDINGFTELTLTHDLFPTEEIKELYHQGWIGCFQNLVECLNQ